MQVAIVGNAAYSLCKAAGVKANCFPAIEDAANRFWDLLALTRDAARRPFSGRLYTHTILLPGDSAPPASLLGGARQVVGYGFSPRDTLTLSSVTGTERLLCLQRSLITVGGGLLEPQEIPLPPPFTLLPPEQALLAAGLYLLILS